MAWAYRVAGHDERRAAQEELRRFERIAMRSTGINAGLMKNEI